MQYKSSLDVAGVAKRNDVAEIRARPHLGN